MRDYRDEGLGIQVWGSRFRVIARPNDLGTRRTGLQSRLSFQKRVVRGPMLVWVVSQSWGLLAPTERVNFAEKSCKFKGFSCNMQVRLLEAYGVHPVLLKDCGGIMLNRLVV